MRPVVPVADMAAADARAQDTIGLDVLVARAGAAVARAALDMLGGAYGRRVVVVAGPGHNGDDGRVAARLLAGRGVRVHVVDATDRAALPAADLVIDAAFGTGLRRPYQAPAPPPGAPVLAVDIPSGVQGDTGVAFPAAVRAAATVTFAALKPGLLLGDGPDHCGALRVADIGLDVGSPRIHLVEDSDVEPPARPRSTHKWRSAVAVVAGSHGMLGSAAMCARAAMRAGAGYALLGVPGAAPSDLPAGEVVSRPLPAGGWDAEAAGLAERCRAMVVGPGLGRSETTQSAVRRVLAAVDVPVVVDADGLAALGGSAAGVLRARRAATVLTPHDGEFARLSGHRPGDDRIGEARALAAATGAVVLLKGSTTVVADPQGDVLLAAAGTPALATAGTGDVLSGVIGALMAQGVAPLPAAAWAAHVHGRAARLGPPGLLAGDLPELIAEVLAR